MSALSLADVRWRTRRDPAGGSPLVQVSFLRHDDRRVAATVGAVESYFASLVGQPRRAYDPDVPATIAGDRVLGRGVALACGHWYRWAALDFAAALPARVAEALDRAGIESPSALRLRLFDLANDRYPGFVPTAHRTEALAALASSVGLEPEDAIDLDRALTLDAEEEAVLVAPDPAPTVGEIVAWYNRAALAALLRQAVRVVFTLDEPEGGLIRRLYALCRRLGVYCDIERAPMLDDAFQLTLAGPDAVVGPPAAAGQRLAIVTAQLLRRMGPLDGAVAELVLRDRACRLPLDRALREVPGLSGETPEHVSGADEPPTHAVREAAAEYDAAAPAFDSEVEARLARAFAALRRQGRASGWRLVREPAPLLAGRRVLLPDFALERGETRVFVEVAGFWTEGYLKKKRQALEHLPPETPLVLAVAPAAAAALAGLPFAMVPYRDVVPVATLLAAVEARYGDFDARTSGAAERLAAACAADARGRLADATLADVLGCFSPGEVARTLAAMALPDGWTYLPGAGLVGPSLLRALDAALAAAWASGHRGRPLGLDDLRALLPGSALPESDEALVTLLEGRPWSCRVVRRSLFAIELHPPGDNSCDETAINAAAGAAAGSGPAGEGEGRAAAAGPRRRAGRRGRPARPAAGTRPLF